MNIGLDVSPIADKNVIGVGNYIINVVTNLAKIDKENKYYLCYRFSHLKKKASVLKIGQDNFRTKIIQEPFNPLFQLKLDLFHGMADRLPWSYRCKNIVTIHDIGSVILNENYSSEHFKKMMAKRYSNMLTKRGADLVITVSEFTKKEILKHYSYPEDNIKVVYLGVKNTFKPQGEDKILSAKAKCDIKKDYFLYVGAVTLRKNIMRILKAFKIFSEKNKSVDLVMIGKLSYGHQEILEEINRLGLNERIKLIGYMLNDELAALYSGAKALVFASLYEGFGLPAIESMACGTPVLTSNTASMPEIAGDAGYLVDPVNINEITEGLFKLAEDKNLRNELRDKGLKRAGFFNWQKTAEETLQLYREVV